MSSAAIVLQIRTDTIVESPLAVRNDRTMNVPLPPSKVEIPLHASSVSRLSDPPREAATGLGGRPRVTAPWADASTVSSQEGLACMDTSLDMDLKGDATGFTIVSPPSSSCCKDHGTDGTTVSTMVLSPLFATASPMDEDPSPRDGSTHSLPVQVLNADTRESGPVSSDVTRGSPSTPPSASTPCEKRNRLRATGVGIVGMVVMGVMVATVCTSTGQCTKQRPSHALPRETMVRDLINHVTLTRETIANLSTFDPTERPEALALHWLVHQDPIPLLPNTLHHTIRLTQRYALLTLYVQYDDFGARIHAVSHDECQWPGVSCTDSHGVLVVTHVNLSHTQWTGEIRPDVGLLSQLVALDASHNRMTGSLSDALGHCTRLESFRLDHGRLTGTIPTTVGHWTAMQHFSVAGNALDGRFPDEAVQQWSQLRHVNVRSNALTGPFPNVTTWVNVQHVDWAHNKLTGPISNTIGQCTRLEYLSVETNALHGTLPSSVANLTHMVYLHAGNNALTGTLPTEMQPWTRLEYFNLSSNKLTGVLPSSFGAMTNLQVFNVTRNRLVGSVPESYVHWSKLEYFDVSMNRLSSVGSVVSAEWTRLRHFSVRHNTQMQGSFAESMGRWNLTYFDASDCNWNGSIPSSVGEWTQLQHFEARDNFLTGSVPDSIGRWTDLALSFNVDRNNLTGTLPQSIGRWSRLELFSVSSNDFTGTIPPSIANWSQMRRAFFEDNNFTGTVTCTPAMISWEMLSVDCLSSVECSCCTCNLTLDPDYYPA